MIRSGKSLNAPPSLRIVNCGTFGNLTFAMPAIADEVLRP
jgi:hypothetical protein